MEKTPNPYAKKTNASDFGAYFNVLYTYVEVVGLQPDVYELGVPVRAPTPDELEKLGAERVFLCESERHLNGKVSVSPMEVCWRVGEVFLYMFQRESILSRLEYMRYSTGDDEEEGEERPPEGDVLYRCKVIHPPGSDISHVLGVLRREPEKKRAGRVHLLCNLDGMLALQRFEVKVPPGGIDLSLNYGGEVSEKFERLVGLLSSDKSGLVLFSGDPGTGKSTFIKHLATKTTRKVIYLSSGAADHITSPDFLSFMMAHRNSVILLEDAEKVLRSRESQDNAAISNILNITDGILGDCLNIMVIATFNIGREKIDPALVRKGRLLLEHHFEALPPEGANRLLERIGSDRRATEPMTLAEIYNPDDNFHEEEEERKVGF